MTEEKGYMNTHESRSFQRIYKEFVDTILKKYCTSSKDVCSLGCYDDALAPLIEYKSLTLVDRKFGPRKSKMTQLKDVYFYVKDIEKFIQEYDEKFDTIIMSTVVEHLPHNVRNKIFTTIKKIMKPNGVLIITFPNGFSTNRLLGDHLGLLNGPLGLSSRDIEVGHLQMYGIRELDYFRRELSLKLIKEIGIMFKPLSHGQMSKYFNEDLDIFIEIGYDIGPKGCSYIGGIFKNAK